MVEIVDHLRIALRDGAEDLQPHPDDIRVHRAVKFLAVP
jgi:hypothetical protein